MVQIPSPRGRGVAAWTDVRDSCRSLAERDDVLRLLAQLPSAPATSDDDVFALIESKKLYASGIGWVDAHLLASSMAGGHMLWTGDNRLAGVAAHIHVLADPMTFGAK